MQGNYPAPWYSDPEGHSKWKEVAEDLRQFFQFDLENLPWKYNEAKLGWRLNEVECKLLEKAVTALAYDCSARPCPMIQGVKRFWQFFHITVLFPVKHGNNRFDYKPEVINKYKPLIKKLMVDLFPGYSIGHYFRSACQTTDDRKPSLHFHGALSRIRINNTDRASLRYFRGLPKDEKPFYALSLMNDLILFELEEMQQCIEHEWRSIIAWETGMAIRSKAHLITITEWDGQIMQDRVNVAHYIANPALHTFRYVDSVKLAEDGKVEIKYKPKNGNTPKPVYLSQRDFVIRYLVEPIRTFRIQGRGWGLFCGAFQF